MARVGIIYKLTILHPNFKRDGKRTFYIGQHWDNRGLEKCFLDNNYWGSGTIWLEYLNALKKKYPDNWNSYVLREILFYSDKVTQRGLDVLERHYIKKYKSHYSFQLGGCNVLWGTANQFGSENPMCDPNVIEKVRQKKKNKYQGERCYWFGKRLSDSTKKKLSDLAKERYKKGKHPSIGLKVSDKHKEILSRVHRGKFWITNGIKQTTLPAGSEIPIGWRKGKLPMSEETKRKLRAKTYEQIEKGIGAFKR